MKIACKSCSARYSVADDKVRGRSFKIRCRGCGAVIVFSGGTAPRWYLALEGVEAGPLTTSELSRSILEGDVGPETSAWRDGLGDWTSLNQLAEFVHLLAPPTAPEGARDLFGPPPEAPELATLPDVRSPGSPLLVGSRNESSVLFSIGNLQALAADAAMTSSAATAPGSGSGLIDIRTMAPKLEQPGAAETRLPVVGAPAAVLLPVLPASTPPPRWLFPVLAGLGSALAASVVALVLALTPSTVAVDKSPTSAPKPESDNFIDTDEVMVKRRGPAKDLVSRAKEPGPTTDETMVEPGLPGRLAARPRVRPRVRPKTYAARPRTARPRVRPAERGPTAATATRPRSKLDIMIDEATGHHEEPPPRVERPKPPEVALPSGLTSRQVQRGMRLIKGGVKGCFDRFKVPGWARMRVTIGGDGRVRVARVKGIFAGTPTGACISSAVSRARFPRFASPSLSVDYPFHLREG